MSGACATVAADSSAPARAALTPAMSLFSFFFFFLFALHSLVFALLFFLFMQCTYYIVYAYIYLRMSEKALRRCLLFFFFTSAKIEYEEVLLGLFLMFWFL